MVLMRANNIIYTFDTVPEDKEVWCVGFRFDDTKAGINCKPEQGKTAASA